MKLKKTVSLLLAGVMIGSVALAGCSSSGNTSESAGSSAANSGNEAESAAAAAS